MPNIPPREPIGDVLVGAVLHVDGRQALVTTGEADVDVRSLVIRYGVPYLGKPHLAIVPGLVALDYGDMLTGEDAWNFLLKRSNLFPRADVVGWRNDGKDEMVTVKTLDLAQPVSVLVYADASAVIPFAQPKALIAPTEAGIPARLLEYLPRFNTVADWQASYE